MSGPSAAGPSVSDAPHSSPPPSLPLKREAGKKSPFRWLVYLAIAGVASLLIWPLLPSEMFNQKIQAEISRTLARENLQFTVEQSELSLFFGATYRMKNVVIKGAPGGPIELDEVVVVPSLLAFAGQSLEADATVRIGDGTIDIHFKLFPPFMYRSNFRIRDLDFRRAGWLRAFWQIGVEGIVNGEGTLSGGKRDSRLTNGNLTMELTQFVLEAQTLRKIPFPRLSVSNAHADVIVKEGNVELKSFQLGQKDTPSDDVVLSLGGNILLDDLFEDSTLNIDVALKFSQTVLQSFSFLDSMLGSARTPDGAFAFKIQGRIRKPKAIVSQK